MKIKIWLALATTALILCGGCSILKSQSTPQPGELMLADDFSNPKTGWDTWQDADGSMVAYQNDGLRILVNAEQYDFWSRPGKSFKNVHIEVDAAKVGGPNDNDYGVICRYQDRNNFYALLISSDGYYGTLKVKEGVYSLIGAETMQFSESIRKGEAINHIRADCVEDGLILWVNGEKLSIVRDVDFHNGDVGVIAGTNATAGVDILFDNFVVYNP